MGQSKLILHKLRANNRWVAYIGLLFAALLLDWIVAQSSMYGLSFGLCVLLPLLSSHLLIDKTRLRPIGISYLMTFGLLITSTFAAILLVSNPGIPSISVALSLGIVIRSMPLPAVGVVATYYVALGVFLGINEQDFLYSNSEAVGKQLLISAFYAFTMLCLWLSFRSINAYSDTKQLDTVVRNRLSNVVINLSDPALMIDGFGRVTFSNTSFLQLIGRDKLDNEPLDQILSLQNSSGAIYKLYEHLGQATSSVMLDDLSIVTKSEPKAVRVIASRILPDLGSDSVDGYLILFSDISESAHLKAEFEEMLHVLAYEMNKPIQNIQADLSSALLSFAKDSSTSVEIIGSTTRNVWRLRDLALNIKTLVSMDSDQQSSDSQTPLSSMLAELADEFKQLANYKGLTLTLHLVDPGLIYSGSADKVRLIIYNVLSNAVHYTAKGTVNVQVLVTGHLSPTVAIAIEDTGIGMKNEQIKQLYDTTSSLQRKGKFSEYTIMGLGLYVAFRLAARVGANIDIISNVGSGTKVTITLPIIWAKT